jgi:hypothetical protein
MLTMSKMYDAMSEAGFGNVSGDFNLLFDKLKEVFREDAQQSLSALARNLRDGAKIEAIKNVRVATGMGLKESKDLVEDFPRAVEKQVNPGFGFWSDLTAARNNGYDPLVKFIFSNSGGLSWNECEAHAAAILPDTKPAEATGEYVVLVESRFTDYGDTVFGWLNHGGFSSKENAMKNAESQVSFNDQAKVMVAQVVAKTRSSLVEIAA